MPSARLCSEYERQAVGVEPDDQTIGAGRRPGLQHAHGLDVRPPAAARLNDLPELSRGTTQ